jgi:hypothetical protein
MKFEVVKAVWKFEDEAVNEVAESNRLNKYIVWTYIYFDYKYINKNKMKIKLEHQTTMKLI